jgi:hypothetical protein
VVAFITFADRAAEVGRGKSHYVEVYSARRSGNEIHR